MPYPRKRVWIIGCVIFVACVALAGGGAFLTETPSLHTKTCMELLPLFVDITARVVQQNAKAWLITLQ